MKREHYRDREQRDLERIFLPRILREIQNGERDKDLEELLLDNREKVRLVAKERLEELNRI
jgi:hypothetical protein